MYKVIGADGNVYGPVTIEQLRQWAAEGRMNAQSRVQAEGSADWKLLGEVLDLPAPPQNVPPVIRPPPVMPRAKAKMSGWVVFAIVMGSILPLIAVMGLLAGLLLPALASAREKARQVQCLNNLRQIGAVMGVYSISSTNRLPEHSWCDALAISGYLPTRKILLCPSGQAGRCSYAFNGNMLGRTWQEDPNVVLIIEGDAGWNGVVYGAAELPPSPHRAGYNVLFNDGHVEFVRTEDLHRLRWIPKNKIELFH